MYFENGTFGVIIIHELVGCMGGGHRQRTCGHICDPVSSQICVEFWLDERAESKGLAGRGYDMAARDIPFLHLSQPYRTEGGSGTDLASPKKNAFSLNPLKP